MSYDHAMKVLVAGLRMVCASSNTTRCQGNDSNPSDDDEEEAFRFNPWPWPCPCPCCCKLEEEEEEEEAAAAAMAGVFPLPAGCGRGHEAGRTAGLTQSQQPFQHMVRQQSPPLIVLQQQ